MSFADAAAQMGVCRVMAQALPRFYKRTGIAVQFNFNIDTTTNEMNVNVGFSGVKDVTPEQYQILLEEVNEAEKLITNDYILNHAKEYQNISQLLFKHQEDTYQIIEKQKANVQDT